MKPLWGQVHKHMDDEHLGFRDRSRIIIVLSNEGKRDKETWFRASYLAKPHLGGPLHPVAGTELLSLGTEGWRCPGTDAPLAVC